MHALHMLETSISSETTELEYKGWRNNSTHDPFCRQQFIQFFSIPILYCQLETQCVCYFSMCQMQTCGFCKFSAECCVNAQVNKVISYLEKHIM